MYHQQFKNFLESFRPELGDLITDSLLEGFSTCIDYENSFDLDSGSENTKLNAIRIINKTLRYLDNKGNLYLPTRLSDFLSKISRKIDTLEGVEVDFNDFYKNYKNLNLNEIKENLANLRTKIRDSLPERLQSLVLDI